MVEYNPIFIKGSSTGRAPIHVSTKKLLKNDQLIHWYILLNLLDW